MTKSFGNAPLIFIALSLALMVSPARAEENIQSIKAPFYVGKSVLACGPVAQVSRTPKAIHINLDRAYPNQSLDLVVWTSEASSYESRLGNLSALVGKTVCGRGLITEYRNRLQIVMKNPQYLRLMSR